MSGRLWSMRTEARCWRDGLGFACLLGAALEGAVCPGRAAQRALGSTEAQSSSAQALAVAPEAPLPPSTPAFSLAGPDLVGRVLSAQGEPVPGAKVLIDAAGPRVGRGYT